MNLLYLCLWVLAGVSAVYLVTLNTASSQSKRLCHAALKGYVKQAKLNTVGGSMPNAFE